ncbi:hypothetical protein AcetOrient_orf02385 [Acetobacter orientalis]|uniref:Uncharacterized protein n=1 Tax=Acetobacter orientalis TaxID=146474 RepID=A0A2Z5ZHA1_9PROT|nr:hypothetical protein AcetOrient_orf02385 [Acetobacter orientalis]
MRNPFFRLPEKRVFAFKSPLTLLRSGNMRGFSAWCKRL